MKEYDIYPVYNDNDDKPLYYVEFHKWESQSQTTWTLFQRQFICSKEEWAKNDRMAFESREMHPWNLGDGIVNESEHAMDMNTRKFLKFMVDALNEKVERERKV